MEEKKSFEYAKEKYEMTEQELEDMYQRIRGLIFYNCIPEQNGKPVAIITGGQPGAGKSGCVIEAKRELADKGKESIVLDVDVYRGLYKNAAELAIEYPEYYSEITDSALGTIMDKLVKETIYKGYNFIFEGTLGNTAIIESIENSGTDYEIIAKLMDVSKFESSLSIFERYLEMEKSMGYGRLTTIDAHDIRYNNFTKIVNTLEKRGIEVEVYKRSLNKKVPTKLYKTSENMKKYPTVSEALKAGRDESYQLCIQNAGSRLELINKEIKDNIFDHNILNELEKLNQIFDKELSKRDEKEER